MTATASPRKKEEKSKEDKINEIMADGATTVKMEIDYSETCDKKLPEAESLASAGKLEEAMEMLTSLEKQTRTGIKRLEIKNCRIFFTFKNIFLNISSQC